MSSIYERIQETMSEQQQWSTSDAKQQINTISNGQFNSMFGETDSDVFMNDIGLKLKRRGGTT